LPSVKEKALIKQQEKIYLILKVLLKAAMVKAHLLMAVAKALVAELAGELAAAALIAKKKRNLKATKKM
jgi:hypothetical protein